MFKFINNINTAVIDDITWRNCSIHRNKGELEQLSILFGFDFISDIHNEMQHAFYDYESKGSELNIEIYWIDKSPIVRFIGNRSGVELGDAFLVAKETFVGKRGEITRNRGVILQAKVTSNRGNIESRKLPLSRMRGSTKKQFELLTEWPNLDIYKSSRSSTPIEANINIKRVVGVPQPYGLYIGAPRSKIITTSIEKLWPSWWMVGFAEKSGICNITFGSFIKCFVNGRRLTNEIGKEFIYSSILDFNKDEWDRLCNAILRIVRMEPSYMPKHIFKTKRSNKSDLVKLSYDGIGKYMKVHGRYPVLIISSVIVEG